MWRELLSASRFAKAAHSGQYRKHGTPYYRHPMAVARILWESGSRDLELLQAAYLHDTLEDTKTTHEGLARTFGERVASLVEVVTKSKDVTGDDYFLRIKAHSQAAVQLKLADRQHNNSELDLLPPEMTDVRRKAANKTILMNKIFFA